MKYICTLFLAFLALAIVKPATYPVLAQSTLTTQISGKNWHYTVPFEVKNKETIEKLIQCESQGINITKPDSDGRYSFGILQFHAGPTNTMQSSTWELFSKASGITGSPMIPEDAIRLTDWAINHGLINHWSCYGILHKKGKL